MTQSNDQSPAPSPTDKAAEILDTVGGILTAATPFLAAGTLNPLVGVGLVAAAQLVKTAGQLMRGETPTPEAIALADAHRAASLSTMDAAAAAVLARSAG